MESAKRQRRKGGEGDGYTEEEDASGRGGGGLHFRENGISGVGKCWERGVRVARSYRRRPSSIVVRWLYRWSDLQPYRYRAPGFEIRDGLDLPQYLGTHRSGCLEVGKAGRTTHTSATAHSPLPSPFFALEGAFCLTTRRDRPISHRVLVRADHRETHPTRNFSQKK